MLTTPGQAPQVAGGRLINCYPEPLAQSAGKPNAYWRVPGLSVWGTVPSGTYRGGVFAAGLFYGVFGTTVYTWTSSGGAGTAQTGSIPGTQFCWCAANQNTPPDVVIVSPGLGAFVVVSGTGVANYPGGVVGSPDSVVFMSGFFLFTYGDGTTRASDVNSTNINSINFATAQSKADALYRPIPLGNGQLLLAGANTLEVWGPPVNSTGYPFSYISTIWRGIPGPSAIAGNEDGWGKGIFFIGDDNKVSTLTTYTPTPISVPDLDILIEAEPDKTKISVGVYVSRGHGMVVVQSPTWCWEYDTTLQSWHERQSYLQTWWRGYQPINVFGNWLCGDTLTASLLKLDGRVRNEAGSPLRMRIETGPIGAFPRSVRINSIELYMTKGVSSALGHDPDETNAMVEISMSRNGGQSWGNPRAVPVGMQSITTRRARASIWGQAQIEGVRWRFDESAGLNFAFMGADMLSDVLR
jgi:hypothetical protein